MDQQKVKIHWNIPSEGGPEWVPERIQASITFNGHIWWKIILSDITLPNDNRDCTATIHGNGPESSFPDFAYLPGGFDLFDGASCLGHATMLPQKVSCKSFG